MCLWVCGLLFPEVVLQCRWANKSEGMRDLQPSCVCACHDRDASGTLNYDFILPLWKSGMKKESKEENRPHLFWIINNSQRKLSSIFLVSSGP